VVLIIRLCGIKFFVKFHFFVILIKYFVPNYLSRYNIHNREKKLAKKVVVPKSYKIFREKNHKNRIYSTFFRFFLPEWTENMSEY
jgi:hypothetical protein